MLIVKKYNKSNSKLVASEHNNLIISIEICSIKKYVN